MDVPLYGTKVELLTMLIAPTQSSVVGGIGIDDEPHSSGVGKDKANRSQFITGAVVSEIVTCCVQVADWPSRVAE